MAEAVISPKVLAWARSRVQMDCETLAGKVNVKSEKVSKWEHGGCR